MPSLPNLGDDIFDSIALRNGLKALSLRSLICAPLITSGFSRIDKSSLTY
jgi:hypothetical protein